MRLLSTIVRATLAKPLDLLDESVVSLRVWPTDLDFNAHMNNGRYLSLMDLGRFDLLSRVGLLRPSLKNGWRPVVGSASLRFRRSLSAFQVYDLRTRIVCWNEKWVFLEQRFERHRKVVAAGAIKGLLRGPRGNVPTSALLEAVGKAGLQSPPMPEALQRWQEMETLAGGGLPGSLA